MQFWKIECNFYLCASFFFCSEKRQLSKWLFMKFSMQWMHEYCSHADTHIVCHPNNKRHKKSHWTSVKNSTFCHRYSIWRCLCVLYLFHFFFFLFLPLSFFLFISAYCSLSLSLLFRNCSILALGALFILFLFWIVLLLLSIKCKQYLVVWHWFQLWTIFFVCSSLFSSLHGNMLDFLCVSFMCCSRKTNQTHILLSLRTEHVNRSNFYGKKSNRCLGKFCSYWSFYLMRYTKQTEIELDETQIRSSSFHSTDLSFKHSFFHWNYVHSWIDLLTHKFWLVEFCFGLDCIRKMLQQSFFWFLFK